MKPNVVLVMVDQMRGDCLGILGHPVVETPNLDMMARSGVLFTNAYSAVPSCVPARAALLTGLSQEHHGRVGYEDGRDWSYPHMLPGEFAEAGYHTQCVGKMHVHPTRNLCGFHNVVLHDGFLGYSRKMTTPAREQWHHSDDYLPWLQNQLGFPADVADTGLGANSWVARPWPYPEHLHPTPWVMTQSIDFLRRRDPTKPFFLTASFVRPHAPLDPPEVLLQRYLDAEIPLPPVGDWADREDSEREGLIPDTFRGLVGGRELRRARAAYYALITQIDFQIGRFLQALEDYDVLKESIVIFLSDHGELLGDHNLFRKYLPYRGSALVPLIVYDPSGFLGAKPGTVVDQVVELRDVMPSLLDFAGLPIPDGLDGRSVKPLLHGNTNGWREYLHGEHSLHPQKANMRPMSNQFIVTPTEKYIWFSQTGREQYFNLEDDPEEIHDLCDEQEHSDSVNRMRSILIKELAGREEGYTDGTQLFVGREPKLTLDSDGSRRTRE